MKLLEYIKNDFMELLPLMIFFFFAFVLILPPTMQTIIAPLGTAIQ